MLLSHIFWHLQTFFFILNSLFPLFKSRKKNKTPPEGVKGVPKKKPLSVAFTVCHISQDAFTLLKITHKLNSIGCITRK